MSWLINALGIIVPALLIYLADKRSRAARRHMLFALILFAVASTAAAIALGIPLTTWEQFTWLALVAPGLAALDGG